MKKITGTCALVATLAATALVWAGDLEPPGTPAPTMVSLQDIYDRVSATPLGIARTGQTECYDSAGIIIACAGTGQDAEYQNGVSVGPRFTDNGNGTVRDHLTGLIWLQDANCSLGTRNWTNALADANALADGLCGLTDGSTAGDWRLPNAKELRSLVDFARFGPPLTAGHPFSGVWSERYWTSTTAVADARLAWAVYFNGGHLFVNSKAEGHFVWPVRGGQ